MLKFENSELNKNLNEIIMLEHIKKGTYLGFEGDYCQRFPILKQGKIKVFRTNKEGKEQVIYYINNGEGCALTFRCIYDNEPLSANIIAEQDSDIYFIQRVDFRNLYNKYSEFRNFILSIISKKYSD